MIIRGQPNQHKVQVSKAMVVPEERHSKEGKTWQKRKNGR